MDIYTVMEDMEEKGLSLERVNRTGGNAETQREQSTPGQSGIKTIKTKRRHCGYVICVLIFFNIQFHRYNAHVLYMLGSCLISCAVYFTCFSDYR